MAFFFFFTVMKNERQITDPFCLSVFFSFLNYDGLCCFVSQPDPRYRLEKMITSIHLASSLINQQYIRLHSFTNISVYLICIPLLHPISNKYIFVTSHICISKGYQ